ncbi:UDP-2-acetamido-3-amino-2,3-dideoxy-glucuronate N-acetyltransferase [Cyclonatronum proteinivorum]|uniref:UDP-2-acetamido-3-amino-2,3-dideoxy-glucuronate N-acetyltransferase n=1 Tax=Cyclonatronum proteinivorum TaxID=1457365 RepID=A0A345UQ03_9BACT|nr:acyltransferase [Cyclonatronum proteinivorum]AXJ02555.1 UDP-2-acetamido-3-amino-2,3-dideoxy-glucuronate N-acetyltransferase [Cyclonatronum proteinivorum]
MRRITKIDDVMIHESAWVDAPCRIGAGTKIWHFCHIQSETTIGTNCVFGQNVNVANGVTIGNSVKIQNNVSVYAGVELEDDVFLGPSCVLTNVTNPRSQVNRRDGYERTLIRRGATVGANATIVCGITLGRYCFVAAGAVVTRSVPDYALMTGNPARLRGWMSRHGHKLSLDKPGDKATCPESGFEYAMQSDGSVRCLSLSEDAPLPAELQTGRLSYRSTDNL